MYTGSVYTGSGRQNGERRGRGTASGPVPVPYASMPYGQ
jgi:hypothetical protein